MTLILALSLSVVGCIAGLTLILGAFAVWRGSTDDAEIGPLRFFFTLFGIGWGLLAALPAVGILVAVAFAPQVQFEDIVGAGFTATFIAGFSLAGWLLAILASSPRLRTPGQPLSWMVVGGGCYLVAAGCLLLMASLSSNPLAIIPLIAIAVYGIRNRRVSRHTELLWFLRLASEKGLPLDAELEAHAEGGLLFSRAQGHLAARLMQSGAPLAEALESAGGPLPRRVLATLATGESQGQLPAALRQVTEQYALQNEPSRNENDVYGVAILLYVCVAATIIISGITIYIVPKFKRIFEDFDMELPPVTQRVLEVFDRAGVLGVLIVLAALAMPLLAWFISTALGWGRHELPYLGRIWPRLYGEFTLYTLGTIVRGKGAIPDGLKVAADYARPRHLGRRLNAVAADVSAGESLWKSLVRQGLLGSHDAAVLASAERVGNLAWALDDVAADIHRRRTYARARRSQFLQPALILILGAAVGLLVYAFFAPLIRLISALS